MKNFTVYQDTDLGLYHYLVKSNIGWNSLKTKAKIRSEQTKAKYHYRAFKV